MHVFKLVLSFLCNHQHLPTPWRVTTCDTASLVITFWLELECCTRRQGSTRGRQYMEYALRSPQIPECILLQEEVCNLK